MKGTLNQHKSMAMGKKPNNKPSGKSGSTGFEPKGNNNPGSVRKSGTSTGSRK